MIPLLITMDLEIAYDHDITEQKMILNKLCKDLDMLGISMTVFATSESADIFPEQIKMIHNSNHEIGCHGLNHFREENYKKISEEKIIENIILSSNNIEDKIQIAPVCFRGPGMTTSLTTQKVLMKNGYIADFSVCSQRIDIFNSIGCDIGWLFAPRLPYKSSDKSPYKKGNAPIWNIPLSCIGIPFISGILYLFGLSFMKFFFRLLLNESLKTKKPIVYIFHSYEFTNYIFSTEINRKLEHPERNKQPLIHKLYLKDPVKRYNINLDLLKYMLSFDSIIPVTGKDYCKYLDNKVE